MLYVYAVILIAILWLTASIIKYWNAPKTIEEQRKAQEAKAKAQDERREDMAARAKARREEMEKRRKEREDRRHRPR